MNNNDVDIGLGLNFDIDAFNAQIGQIFASTGKAAQKAAGDIEKSTAETVAKHKKSIEEQGKNEEKLQKYLTDLRLRSTALADKADKKAADEAEKTAKKSADAQIKEAQRAAREKQKLADQQHRNAMSALASVDANVRKQQQAEQKIRSEVKLTGNAQKKAQSDLAAYSAHWAQRTVEIEKKKTKDVVRELTKLQEENKRINRLIEQEDDVRVKKQLRNVQKGVKEEISLYDSVARKRPGVQRNGEGVSAGLLGTGRNIISGAGIGIGQYAGYAGAGLAIGAGMKFAIDKSAEFETAMADLHALTGVGGSDLEGLGKKARELGVDYGTSAKDGVEAFKLVISALGPSIAKDQNALNEMGDDVLKLAKASGVDAPQAASVLTTALNQFGYGTASSAEQAKEMTRIMNVMAAGAKEGAAEVPDLSEAIKIVGTVANQSGVSIEGAAAAIEVLSMNGLKGQEAGTAYRNILLGISAGSKNSAAAMKILGISFNEINPQINGQEGALTNLKQAYDKIQSPVDKSFVLTHLFGKENIAAGNILLNNVDALHKMTSAITDTNTAQDQANIKMETSAERWNRVKANMEDFAIGLGSKLLPVLDAGVQGLDSLVSSLFGLERQLDRSERKREESIAKQNTEFIDRKLKEKIKGLRTSGVGGQQVKDNAYTYLESSLGLDELTITDKQRSNLISQVDSAINAIDDEVKKAKVRQVATPTKSSGGKSRVDSAKEAFQKQKSIYDDAMAREKTDIELHGIETNASLESIKKDQLEVEIKYDKLIADAAIKYGQYANSYLLDAAKQQSGIQEMFKKKSQEFVKTRESILGATPEFPTLEAAPSKQEEYQNLVIAGMEDGKQKELALLDQKFQEEQAKYQDNYLALRQLAENYAKDRNGIISKYDDEFNRGVEQSFGSGMNAAIGEFFRPLNEELGQAKGVLGSFFNAFIQGIEQALANELVQKFVKLLFHSGGDSKESKGSKDSSPTDFLGSIGGILFSLLPLSDGGYTGNGGKYEPKGIVHGGEYVFSKEATNKVGVGNLNVIHDRLKGYSKGGFVDTTKMWFDGNAPKWQSNLGDTRGMWFDGNSPGIIGNGLGQTNGMWFDGNSPGVAGRGLGQTNGMWFDGNSPGVTNRNLGSTAGMWFDGNSPGVKGAPSYMYQHGNNASAVSSALGSSMAGVDMIVRAIRSQKLTIGQSQLYSANNREATNNLDYSW